MSNSDSTTETVRCECAFLPTHRITFTPLNGDPQVDEVCLIDGAAYTREEWDADAPAGWERSDDGHWTHEGQATPGGANGTVDVEAIGD